MISHPMDSGFDFWGAALTPGKVVKCTIKDALLHVTSICLGESVQNSKERSVVSVTHSGRSYVIASLREGVCEQVTIDLVFKENEEFRFRCTGQTPVHLVGYVQPISDDDDQQDDEDDERFEECCAPDDVCASQSGQKRPAPQVDESSSETGDSDSDEAIEEEEQQPPVKKAKSEPVPEPKPVEVETPKKSKGQLKREKRAAQLALKGEQPETPKSAVKELSSDVEAVENQEQPTPAKKAQSEPEPKPVEVETPNKTKRQLKQEKKAAQMALKGEQPETPKSAKKVQPETPKSAKKESEFRKLGKGLLAKDVEIGHGKEAKKGSRCGMFYTGRLKNGKVFDSNTKSKKPFMFKLGAGQVISGWEIGVAGMKVGGKRLLVVPPKLGYGAQGAGSDIPPHSVLVFEVELARVN